MIFLVIIVILIFAILNDVEKIYFSIPCTSGVSCEHCKNKLLCDLTANLLKSLKNFYYLVITWK